MLAFDSRAGAAPMTSAVPCVYRIKTWCSLQGKSNRIKIDEI